MEDLFSESYQLLNDEQREAVDTLEGPVLVIAGPGTGKTQLLSLRVANILRKRDVSPGNILCLTFTNAGADAMRQRLMRFIGADAYNVTIGTFHSFAQSLRTDYPEYFKRGYFDRPITNLKATKTINQFLNELKVIDPLYQNPYEGVSGNLKTVKSLIDKIKNSGLTASDIITICCQNRSFFDYLEHEKPEVFEKLALDLNRGTKAEKKQRLDELKTELLILLDSLPESLTEIIPTPTGSYEPYALLLRRAVEETDFYDESGKSTGFRELIRNRFFKGTPLRCKDRRANDSILSAVNIYQKYQDYLQSNALYDFSDMILDASVALERHGEFAAALREQYSYIMIDEFQDTNGAQMKIIETIVSGLDAPNILAVGDDDQSIMRFQGASVEFIQQFEKKYANTRSIVLQKNYRSVPSIVEFGQCIAAQIEGRLQTSKESKQLVAARGASSSPDFSAKQYTAPEIQYYRISEEIAGLIANGFMEKSENPGSEIAVIARKHDSLKALIPYLEHFGVAFNYRVRREVSQIASLQTAFSIMRFAVHWCKGETRWAELELPRMFASPEFGLAQTQYFQIAREARIRGGWVSALEACEEPLIKERYSWLCDTAIQAISAPAQEAILSLCASCIEYYQANAQKDPYSAIEFNYGIKTLLHFASEEIRATTPARQREEGSQGPVRLDTVVTLLGESELFGVEVSASIPLANERAITLTTAHSSKGLEYDLVYLIDADRTSWRKSGGGANLVPQNIYLSETEDEDDFRRLLFVAATRARDDLRISLTGSSLVPELMDISSQTTEETGIEDIQIIAPLSWQERYLPSPEAMAQMTTEALATRKLSVSLLNSFVEFKGNTLTGENFFIQKLLDLPQKPSVAADFGTIVHDYFAALLNEVYKAGTKTDEQLIAEVHDAIRALDHPEEAISHLSQRFDLIVRHFMPTFKERLVMQALAEKSFTILLDNVPLTGRTDLVVPNEDDRTLKIYDYKTGAAKKPGAQGANYLRQLQFYKLLIENTAEFSGWKVVGGADIFVEPDRKNGMALPQEEFVYVSDEELDHLRRLIVAVWHRLQNNLLDTSGFLESTTLATLRATSVYKSAGATHKVGDPKEPSADDYQQAYERWLIEEHERQINSSMNQPL